jgi:hypothetical protein
VKAFTIKNELGYFVGCIEYSNGVIGKVSNAKTHDWQAQKIADRMLESHIRIEQEKSKIRYHDVR